MIIFSRYFIATLLYAMSHSVFASSAPSGAISQSDLLRVVTGLFLVILIIVLLSWLVKKVQAVNVGSTKGVQTLATMPLGPKEKVILIRVAGRNLLLGVGSSSVNLLYDFGDQLPVEFDSVNKPSFAELLKSAIGKS